MRSVLEYRELWRALKLFDPADFLAYCRTLAQTDLYFLLRFLCNRLDIENDWLLARCNEVQAEPDGMLDLWARDHYKSTIITFALTIQDILKNPEETIAIASHTNPIAKAFLVQIKRELGGNELLKAIFPDILYKNPAKESPRWSDDGGIIVKRKSNPKEATVESFGVVDAQPISRHFSRLVYDDLVTEKSVTEELIPKTTHALRLSFNLGTRGGVKRFIGTRYHFNDTYKTLLDEGIATPRTHPATIDGLVTGGPVFLTAAQLEEKRKDLGAYVFACQMLQDPTADTSQGFKEGWLKYYGVAPRTHGWNKYILVDPASKKKKNSDYTVIMCIGLGSDNNYYLLDAVRDRLNLTERATTVFKMVRKWNPLVVGYEEYGLQADVEHMQYMMTQENYRFNIRTLGGGTSKIDRIKKLVPIFEYGRMWLPHTLEGRNYQGKSYNFISQFIRDEYLNFPVPVHDDMLDCMARILDPALGAVFPELRTDAEDCGTALTEYDMFG